MRGKVSSQLNTAIEGFLENAGNMAEHIDNVSNPHAVTKSQVGLSSVTNDAQATKTEFTSHAGNVSNPHGVTKTQVGLSNVTNDKQATSAELTAHTTNVSNPHSVTKTQVGLGSVLNSEQATKTEYNAHVAGTTDKHGVTGITYDVNRNLKQYLDALQLEAGSGTMDHSLLVNRDLAEAHPVSSITGLSQAIGHETYTFFGTTADATETELFTTDTGAHIDANGRIKFDTTEALAIDIKVIAGVETFTGKIYAAKYSTQKACVTIPTTITRCDLSTAETIGNDTMACSYEIVANNPPEDGADGSLSLKVVGVESSELWWKAIFTITPMSLSEFE